MYILRIVKGERIMPDQTPIKTTDDNSQKTKKEAQKELIEELKAQWKLLWSERYDDRVRAEGVSVNDYAILDIEKGTIIHATKDFKILSLKQILEKHQINNPERYVQPNVEVRGME